jgi:hypothetical protein
MNKFLTIFCLFLCLAILLMSAEANEQQEQQIGQGQTGQSKIATAGSIPSEGQG